MFFGEYVHSVDAKNRVFVPKRLAELLDPNPGDHRHAILTRGVDGCLFLYSQTGFDAVLARFRTEAYQGRDLRVAQRLFASSTHPLTLDAQGRLLLPEKLKALAEIDKEVVFVGVFDRIELWAKERWEGFEGSRSDEFDELAELLVGPISAGSSVAPEAQLGPEGAAS